MSRRNQSIITEMVDDADQEVWRKPTSSDDPVLALVKDGRVDAEIAVRLGISNAEVKERIERLVAKHAVRNRSELREPPKPAAVEELVPIEVETVAADRVSPVRAALWAGAVALVVGLGAGWWIRDEQARVEAEDEAAYARTQSAKFIAVAELLARTPGPAAEHNMGILFRTENGSSALNLFGPDGRGGKDITLVNTATVDIAAGPWSIQRLVDGHLTLVTRLSGDVVILRLQPSDDATLVQQESGVVRISTKDGSTPKVNMTVEGADWSLGLDGRLVVYL